MPVFTGGPYGRLAVLLNVLGYLNKEIIIVILILIIIIERSSQKGNDRSPESHYKSVGTFKMLKSSLFHSQWSNLAKNEIIQNIVYILITASLKKVSDELQPRKSGNIIFRHSRQLTL